MSTEDNTFADDAQKKIERLKKKIYKAPAPFIPGRRYYWVFGWTPLGKAVLWGPYTTNQEAELNATVLDTYEIFVLNTIDTAKASREVKHELIARGEDPDEAMKRLIHKHAVEEPKVRKKKWF